MKRLMVAWLALVVAAGAQDPGALRRERDRMVKKGLWRELVDQYRDELSGVVDQKSGQDLTSAVNGVQELGAWNELDGLVEDTVVRQLGNAEWLMAAAQVYQSAPHNGRIVGGEFERGHWGGVSFRGRGVGDEEAESGEPVSVDERDRARGLQLALQAVEAAADEQVRLRAWATVGRLLMQSRNAHQAWKLQVLTPLDELPDWRDLGPQGGTEGAPWLGEGPVLYQVPQSWEAAANDGERWRWALAEREKSGVPGARFGARMEWADFLRGQFGVGTLASFGWWRTMDPDSAKGLLEIDTLGEDEFLAKTSDGVKRFKLPEEQNFIAIYGGLAGPEDSEPAYARLVEVFLDRRQRDRAAAVLDEKIEVFKPKKDHPDRQLHAQITGNWGRFEHVPSFPAGSRPELPLVFRNAGSVKLSAAKIDMVRVLGEVRDHLQGNPLELDHNRINPGAIGWRIVRERGDKFLGKPVEWQMALKARDGHRDTRAMVEVPVEGPGAWLVTAELPDGNTSRIVVWLEAAALLKRPVADGLQWWAADSVTGAPLGGAEFEFFGYRTERLERKLPIGRRYKVITKSFSRVADADGRVVIGMDKEMQQFSWMVTAKGDGKTAFFGFEGFGWSNWSRSEFDQVKVFGVSDRPLYKAGDKARVKFWLRRTAYDFDAQAAFAGQGCKVEIFDGTGQKVTGSDDLKTDAWGGVEYEFEVPEDARLGEWRAGFRSSNRGGTVSFRVEEYRKPEYEVSVDAPDRPVRLGEVFDATVRANYFHGAPVTEASVKVKVTRSSINERWFPAWRWDWLYGRGAWWPMGEAAWHPGWDDWCCIPPHPPWWGGDRWTPDELVFEKTLPIGADGTVKVRVDTALAKEIHGDIDARYKIDAEVVDASRRSESGSGSVTAARRPFEVVVWLDRGWARPGEQATAEWSASTLDGVPVKRASGTLELLRLIPGANGRTSEESVNKWQVKTDDEGKGSLRFELPAEGQYRLAATLTAAGGGEAVEGATVIGVHGKGGGGKFRFGPLEIVADKISYRPGETARLRVQSDRADASVWMFLRTEQGGAKEARRIDLAAGSAEFDLSVDLADMPNIFVEGVTVHGGSAHTAVRQILLPPESRVLGVDLDAPPKVKPRDKSKLLVRVTDGQGKPIRGTAVLTVYDKALEAIVGGSNVGRIDEHFWSWRRHYNGGAVRDSLGRLSGQNILKERELTMLSLGRFGDDAVTMKGQGGGGDWGGGGFGLRARAGALMEFAMESDELMMDAAPMAAAAPAMREMAAADGESGGAGAPAITVRKDFADAIKWSGTVEVGEDGIVELPLEFPDNLTTWKAKVWVLGAGTRVGEGSAEIVTSKDLLVRLQAPRFLVERDEAVLSAIVHNYREEKKSVAVSLEIPGGMLEKIGGEDRSVEIEPGGEARVEWRVRALREGEAVVRMIARADDDGDAMEKPLPIMVHGMLRQDAWSRVVDPGADSAVIEVEVPEMRRPEQTKLTVRFSPTVAGAVVDAIPYLADYPHGCTEQTLNRFVPAVIARKMLADLGIDLEVLKAKRANLNPQEIGDPEQRAAQWKQWKRNPVFDPEELDKMVGAGLAKLAEMQNRDGGWGWFSGWGEHSYPHTTAVVVHGLLEAKAAGVKVNEGMLKRGIGWLEGRERGEVRKLQRHVREMKKPEGKRRFRDCKQHADAIDALVRRVLGEGGSDGEPMLGFLFRDRLDLPVYAQCLLGLELHRGGAQGRRDECLATIEQFRKDDAENQTSYLELPNRGYWWFWYGGDAETHAWYLKLLSAVKPKAAETRGLVKYLVNNRKHASWWDSTRDTAYCVEAIAGYLKASGEDAPEMEVDVMVDGKLLRNVTITRENMFFVNNTVVVAGDALAAGRHKVEVLRKGKGTVYANAYLEVFTLEDHLRAAGLEVKVARMVRKLTPTEGTTAVPDAVGLITEQKTEAMDRKDLGDGDMVESGDLVEVELIIESKNDYEYIIFEDWKPAGFEPVKSLSGYLPGALGAYMEPRDEMVGFYIRSLPRGTHTIRYRLRAETPGVYHALPARAEPMYAPELKANSEEIKLGIE